MKLADALVLITLIAASVVLIVTGNGEWLIGLVILFFLWF